MGFEIIGGFPGSSSSVDFEAMAGFPGNSCSVEFGTVCWFSQEFPFAGFWNYLLVSPGIPVLWVLELFAG